MTDAELTGLIVERINSVVNVPMLSEEQEAKGISYLVGFVLPLLSEPLRRVLLDSADGISPAESQAIGALIVEQLTLHVNLKWIPDYIEPMVWQTIVDKLMVYAQQGYSLHVQADS